MTNLDAMKKTLVNQIMGMDACRRKYGDCEEDDRPNLCDTRFAEYAGMEI